MVPKWVGEQWGGVGFVLPCIILYRCFLVCELVVGGWEGRGGGGGWGGRFRFSGGSLRMCCYLGSLFVGVFCFLLDRWRFLFLLVVYFLSDERRKIICCFPFYDFPPPQDDIVLFFLSCLTPFCFSANKTNPYTIPLTSSFVPKHACRYKGGVHIHERIRNRLAVSPAEMLGESAAPGRSAEQRKRGARGGGGAIVVGFTFAVWELVRFTEVFSFLVDCLTC